MATCIPISVVRSRSPEIRLPPGRLRLAVRDEAGAPLSFVVWVDTERFEADAGLLDVGGVPDGPHLLLLGARDHVGQARRIVLRAGETREIEIVLPPR